MQKLTQKREMRDFGCPHLALLIEARESPEQLHVLTWEQGDCEVGEGLDSLPREWWCSRCGLRKPVEQGLVFVEGDKVELIAFEGMTAEPFGYTTTVTSAYDCPERNHDAGMVIAHDWLKRGDGTLRRIVHTPARLGSAEWVPMCIADLRGMGESRQIGDLIIEAGHNEPSLTDTSKQAVAPPRGEREAIADEIALATQELGDADIVHYKDIGGELFECDGWIIPLH
jgi:hypothetical protein